MSSSPTPTVQPRPYQDPLETWSAKFVRKFKENPWVPIGCAATCGALVMSAYKMRAGKSKDMNYWLRARVVLQGLTLVALVGGSMMIQKSRTAEIADSGSVSLEDEATREKERLEFEERLKEAERVSEEEATLLRVVKGPVVNRQNKQAPPTGQRDGPTTTAVKNSSSWWWWSRGKGSESQDSDQKV